MWAMAARTGLAANRPEEIDRRPQIALPGHSGPLEVVCVNSKTWEATFRVRTPDGLFGPEFTTRLSLVLPMSDEDTLEFWKMLVADLLAQLKAEGQVPDFLKGHEVRIGNDSTNDPAVYVRLLVAPSRKPAGEATVAQWNRFADLVQDKLVQLRLQRWPYVQLGEWRRKR